MRVRRAGLIVALAAVNVALGHLDAELVVVAVVLELALLLVADRYRTRFLLSPPAAGGPRPRRAPGAGSS